MRPKEYIVVLHNIRSTYNVGAILRTLEGLGATRVIFSGYTPRFDDQRILPHLRDKTNRAIAKAALGAEALVPQESVSNLSDWLRKQSGYTIIGLENNLSPSEFSRQLILGQDKLNFTKVILVLGEEVDGIPPEIRQELNYFLEIPMQGQKESFNVSVAAAIASWEILNPRPN